MVKIPGIAIILLSGLLATSTGRPDILVSKEFQICTKEKKDVKFDLHSGLDAIDGVGIRGQDYVKIYIGRHPVLQENNFLHTEHEENHLRLIWEGLESGSERHQMLYSYSVREHGFGYPVFDQVFVLLSSEKSGSINLMHSIGSSLYRCPRSSVDG